MSLAVDAPAGPDRGSDGYRFESPVPLDLRTTIGAHRVGGRDRVTIVQPGGVWRATRTPEGPATLHVRPADGSPLGRAGTDAFVAHAWGPGAAWALAQAPELVGVHDTAIFDPPPGPVAELHRRHPALRFGRSRAVVEALIPTILEQKVTTAEAHRSYHGLLRAFGDPAPGPAGARGLRLGPDPARLAELTYFHLHRFGIERKRADTVLRVYRRDDRFAAPVRGPDGPAGEPDGPAAVATGGWPAASPGDGHEAPVPMLEQLRHVPGIGPWTLAIVAQKAFGDPDAVIVGDYHLPNLVAWSLAGEARADDARMLALLEPFAGHRGRVVRLLAMGGSFAPKFGPGKPLRDFSRY